MNNCNQETNVQHNISSRRKLLTQIQFINDKSILLLIIKQDKKRLMIKKTSKFVNDIIEKKLALFAMMTNLNMIK
jgi:hypothetical protein